MIDSYIALEARTMERFCRLYHATPEDFVKLEAEKFHVKHSHQVAAQPFLATFPGSGVGAPSSPASEPSLLGDAALLELALGVLFAPAFLVGVVASLFVGMVTEMTR